MQLRACDAKDKLIFAHQAAKQCDYFCLECKGVLRLRGGFHRQKHFYHLKPSLTCRQNGKSMEHLQVQCAIQQGLGDECALELSFPSIGRIADCAWLKRQIIFEIQCSAITQEEVAARNADYASLGYRVVWLLHDSRYNQRRLSAAESWLRDHPHYFTNIDAQGRGHVYDQYDEIERGKRKKLLSAAPIDLTQLYTSLDHPLPVALEGRHKAWQIGFKGDWVDLAADESLRALFGDVLDRATQQKSRTLCGVFLWLWEKCIATPYRIAFAYLLEKSCR